MPARVAALALAVLLGLAAVAAATPAQELESAREQFRAGQFADAAKALNYLLYPQPRLSQEDDLIEAHVLLAVSAFEIGDRKTAVRELEEALFLSPSITLDPLLFSENAIDFFEDVKADIEEREAREAELRRVAEEKERLQKILEAMVVVEKRPYYINFIPFGAGQFQNGQNGKGLFFAASQGVTGGLSAGIWLYLVGEYGLPGKVPPGAEAERALLLQKIEIGAGAVCLGLMAWGIVDSLLNYEPSVVGEPDESLLPPELRKKPPPPETSFRLDPLALPGGAGLSLTWEH